MPRALSLPVEGVLEGEGKSTPFMPA